VIGVWRRVEPATWFLPKVYAMPITASTGSAGFAASKADLDDLIKRRFFFRQAFEIYGGVGGFFTYGPPGAAV
jgi:hypothetical protein